MKLAYPCVLAFIVRPVSAKWQHRKHACIFLAPSGAGIWVLDQYTRSETIIRRHIGVPRDHKQRADGSWENASNNAMAFSVIER